MVNTPRISGLCDIHIEIDNVDDSLNYGRDNTAAAGAAKHQKHFTVLHDNCGRL